MSEVRKDIEKAADIEWHKYFDEVGRGEDELWRDKLTPIVAYPLGMLATGAVVGGRLGRMVGRPRTGTIAGGGLGGATGLYGSVVHERLRKKHLARKAKARE